MAPEIPSVPCREHTPIPQYVAARSEHYRLSSSCRLVRAWMVYDVHVKPIVPAMPDLMSRRQARRVARGLSGLPRRTNRVFIG